MMATVPHVTSGLGLRKFQADGFLLTRMYRKNEREPNSKKNCILLFVNSREFLCYRKA